MGDKKRVLVVDDDPDVRRLVSIILGDAGYDPQTAVDGEHALRSALALKPDLIILDLHVPETSLAVRFADTYRERVAAERRAPIVALSGSDDLEAVGQRLGASAFVKKPFAVDELLQVAAKFLADPVHAVETDAAPAEIDAPPPGALPEAEPGTATG